MIDYLAKGLEHAPYLVICILGMLAMTKMLSKSIKEASDRCHDVTDRTLKILEGTGRQLGENTESMKETRVVLRETRDVILRLNGKRAN